MRIFLQYVLPFLLPTLVYLLWVVYATRKATVTGGPAPKLGDGPWPWLIGSGAGLAIVMLAVIALTSGHAPDAGTYIAPRFENGEIVPSRYE